MMRKMPRTREYHTKPGERERLVSVKLMIPKAANEQLKALERGHRHTKEEVFLAGIDACTEH